MNHQDTKAPRLTSSGTALGKVGPDASCPNGWSETHRRFTMGQEPGGESGLVCILVPLCFGG